MKKNTDSLSLSSRRWGLSSSVSSRHRLLFLLLLLLLLLGRKVPTVAARGVATSTDGSPQTSLIVSLHAATFSLRNEGANVSIDSRCELPGDVYMCLLANGVIGDPYYRSGDLAYRWIAFDNWIYSKNVSVTSSAAALCASPKVELMFDGVQIISSVFVNGYFVGKTSDQFVEYRFDVTDALSAGSCAQGGTWNGSSVTFHLALEFTSSITYATQMFDEYNWTTPKPNAPDYLVGLPHRNFVRGEQSSFGWDWGPAFAPVGVPLPFFLRIFEDTPVSAAFDYVVPHVLPLPLNTSLPAPLSDDQNSFHINVRVYFTLVAPRSALDAGSVMVRVQGDDSLLQNVSSAAVADITPNDGDSRPRPSGSSRSGSTFTGLAAINLTVHNVPLWWPRGFGPQQLVHLKATIVMRPGVVLATRRIRTGIRAVELITYGDPLSGAPASTVTSAPRHDSSTQGTPPLADEAVIDRPVMFFRVNGVPVFAKGANMIPLDAFATRVDDAAIADILESAVRANMNMVRVWGGGIFLPDSFYDQADELGLLVWQEMIFACAEYPVDPPFLFFVRNEIRHQLRRLGRHPSIAMWSGNNENGIYDKGPGSPYEVLNDATVLETVVSEDTSRPVWPSSPSDGFAFGVNAAGLPAGTMDSPLPFKTGGDSGDTHFYNYANCPDVSIYPRTNFASEYGFQSLPWLSNFEPVSEPQDWSLFSPLMEHRQHHQHGNSEIAALVRQNFRVPDLNSSDVAIFERVIFLSQLQQMLCIADESSFYRRGRNTESRTMGMLYWQLNQIWQAPSWTSLEYGGEWKVLHYAMARVFDVFHVSAFHNATTDAVVAHIASDSPSDIMDAHATVALVPFDATPEAMPPRGDGFVIANVSIPRIPSGSGVFYFEAARSSLLTKYRHRCPRVSSCFLLFAVYEQGAASPLAPPSPLWLSSLKDAELAPDAAVDVTTLSVALDTAQVRLCARSKVVLFAFLRSTKYSGSFSDNAVVLLPNVSVYLTFTVRRYQRGPKLIESIADFQKHLHVQMLNDQ